MSDTKDLRNIVDELLLLESGLSDWEIDFIEGLRGWRSDFTPKQAALIEKLAEKLL